MKIIQSTDYHLRIEDSAGVSVNGVNSRLLDRVNSLSIVVNYAIENKADAFFILGDIFNKINPIEKLRTLFVATVINPLISNGIPIVIVPGNHDTNFDITSFQTEALLASVALPNAITFIKEPTILDFEVFKGYFIPYGCDIPKENEGCIACFAHHGVKGAETGVGVVERKGEKHELSDFSVFPITFSGHYHKPQILHGKGHDFVFIGSTNRWDMGERLDNKRFIELNIDENGLSWKSIPLPDRQFKQFVISEGESFELTEDIKDCVVKIIFEGSKLWLKTLNIQKIKKSYEGLNPHKVTTAVKVTDTDNVSQLNVVDTDTFEDVVEKYCKKNNVNDELTTLGLELLKSV